MPDFDWLDNLVLDQAHRRMPRSLRGFNHHTIKHGLEKAFAAIKPENLNACAPAAVVV
ncbi:hypothetical protein [uncultured Xylophilus sp.]|uniref:hypothetical protein n=1 Tax=uncultured Xylophilus sp. TaxID=296832 RepID=UPI0025EEF53E|nr:hypothetical protein [uncultured Xylophilus sp.]